MTVSQMAHDLGLDPGRVEAGACGPRGRGNGDARPATRRLAQPPLGNDLFTPPESQGTPPLEWCDRRLLARIHRLTLDRLRRQSNRSSRGISRFFPRINIAPDHRLTGPAGVREVIRQLQGFEMAAGVWERRILPLRVTDYDPAWLDQLAFSGELAWGRLRPFRPEENGPASRSRLTRAVPLSLVLRNDLPWLLPRDRDPDTDVTSSGADAVVEALRTRNAALLPRSARRHGAAADAIGRGTVGMWRSWACSRPTACASACVSGAVARAGPPPPAAHAARCWNKPSGGCWPVVPLSRRPPHGQRREVAEAMVAATAAGDGACYSVICLHASGAPSWGQLVPVLAYGSTRRNSRRKIVAHVGGEQYAAEDAVEKLRRVAGRDAESATDFLVVAGSDPLNLAGVVTPGDRVGAGDQALALRDGHVVAAFEGGQISFRENLAVEVGAELSRRLRRTG